MARYQEFTEASARGTDRLIRWKKDGTLVCLKELAKAWGVELEAIQAAVDRDDLFVVWVDDSPHVSAELLELGAERSYEICRSLDGQPASSKLIFLLRAHGCLEGKTVLAALRAGTPLERILQLAQVSALS